MEKKLQIFMNEPEAFAGLPSEDLSVGFHFF